MPSPLRLCNCKRKINIRTNTRRTYIIHPRKNNYPSWWVYVISIASILYLSKLPLMFKRTRIRSLRMYSAYVETTNADTLDENSVVMWTMDFLVFFQISLSAIQRRIECFILVMRILVRTIVFRHVARMESPSRGTVICHTRPNPIIITIIITNEQYTDRCTALWSRSFHSQCTPNTHITLLLHPVQENDEEHDDLCAETLDDFETVGTDTGGGPGGRKRKMKRDPHAMRKAPLAPKRFKSSYICFFMAKQGEIKEALGDEATVSAISKRSAEMWYVAS